MVVSDEQLNSQLSSWLGKVDLGDGSPVKGCKAIIAPFVSSIDGDVTTNDPHPAMRDIHILDLLLLGPIKP